MTSHLGICMYSWKTVTCGRQLDFVFVTFLLVCQPMCILHPDMNRSVGKIPISTMTILFFHLLSNVTLFCLLPSSVTYCLKTHMNRCTFHGIQKLKMSVTIHIFFYMKEGSDHHFPPLLLQIWQSNTTTCTNIRIRIGMGRS